MKQNITYIQITWLTETSSLSEIAAFLSWNSISSIPFAGLIWFLQVKYIEPKVSIYLAVALRCNSISTLIHSEQRVSSNKQMIKGTTSIPDSKFLWNWAAPFLMWKLWIPWIWDWSISFWKGLSCFAERGREVGWFWLAEVYISSTIMFCWVEPQIEVLNKIQTFLILFSS